MAYKALNSNVTSSNNTAVGAGALRDVTSGLGNTTVGSYSMSRTTGGVSKTAVGWGALYDNTTGHRNIAVGRGALADNTSAVDNVAVGYGALGLNTTGSNNIAIGRGALAKNTTQSSSVAVGHAAAYNNTGAKNTAFGTWVLLSATTGQANVAVGYGALRYTTTGDRNTAIGYRALRNNTGTLNVALGRNAGLNATTGSNNIFIANVGVAGDDDVIKIGTEGTQAKTYVAGIRGIMTGVADAATVMIDSAGQLCTVNSSERFKTDVRDMEAVSRALLELRPVTFRYKDREYADGQYEYGLIAEEVAAVFPELVIYDAEGKPLTVRYHLLSTLLLNELQRHLTAESRETERLRARLAELEAEVEGLRSLRGASGAHRGGARRRELAEAGGGEGNAAGRGAAAAGRATVVGDQPELE